MKMGKDIFTVIIVTVAKRKDASLSNSMLNHPGHVTLTSWIYLEIFTSGSYERDMKILKRLASNSKWVRVFGIFSK